MSQYLRAFNDHFMEFVDDIERVFPNDVDIVAAKMALITIRKSNPKILITTFKECVAKPYKDEIENGNIDFFINKDYGNDLGEGQEANAILDKIDSLRGPIRQMREKELENIVVYIQNLTRLCYLYN